MTTKPVQRPLPIWMGATAPKTNPSVVVSGTFPLRSW